MNIININLKQSLKQKDIEILDLNRIFDVQKDAIRNFYREILFTTNIDENKLCLENCIENMQTYI